MTETMFYELKLPSRLIPYEGVDKVEIRLLKGEDEKFIGELTTLNFEKKFKQLLARIIKGIDPGKLTIGDRLYIIAWIAINCYTPMYPIELMCETCLRKIKVDIDLGQLEKIELPEGYTEPHAVTLLDGSTINLRQLTINDNIAYFDYAEKRQQDDLHYKLAMSIVSEDDLVKRAEMIKNMGTRDIALIRAFHDKYYHGPKMEAGYTCPKCGGAGVTPVPFRLDILFPDGQAVARALGHSV
jgi:hypothetical protein